MTALEARKIGIRACMDKIGYEFCVANKDNACTSYGENIPGFMFCFVGIDDSGVESDSNILKLSDIKGFTHSACCNVDMETGEIEFLNEEDFYDDVLVSYIKVGNIRELHEKLRNVPDSYPEFASGMIRYAATDRTRKEKVLSYMNKHPAAKASEISKFVMCQNDFYEAAKSIRSNVMESNIAILKSWYMTEVEHELISRGVTSERAKKMILQYKLKERIDAFTYIQLERSIETTADEILHLDIDWQE